MTPVRIRLFAFAGFIFHMSNYGDGGETMLDLLNFIVLAVTLVVLCIYTWVTKQMQRVNTKQMQLGIKPLISIEPKDKVHTYWVLVKNIGNGTAINIEFDLIKLGENLGWNIGFRLFKV